MACINIKSKEFQDLMEATKLPSFLLEAKISKFQRDNVTDEFPSAKELVSDSEVNQSLKAVEILNSDKAKQIFEKGNKANWDLNKILTELQIPKEQKQLILDRGHKVLTNNDARLFKDSKWENNDNLIEQIITDLLSNYSYTVEVNTAKEPTINKNVDYENDGIFDEDGNFQSENTTFSVNGFLYEKDKFKHIPFGYGKIKSEDGYIGNNDWKSISEREYEEALDEFESKEGNERPTQHYSNLTVPGGANYIENEIKTPGIVPSIKGHAQFATDNGIGWFRSDDKQDSTLQWGVYTPENELLASFKTQQEAKEFNNKRKDKDWNQVAYIDTNIKDTKTRRVLEVQSDLFQKGRGKKDLTRTSRTRLKKDGIELHISFDKLEQAEKFVNEQSDKSKYEIIKPINNENQFLQLLNKDNNWVTFFVKSIIQDSVKKGYEKVLFPAGDTASKIEGHTTLEEYKKTKLDRLKELETKKLDVNNSQKDEYSDAAYGEVQGKEDYLNSINNEINQLNKELEDVEGPGGFGALKPIYDFYETRVQNVLNKQYGKDNVNRITDEYGNDWFEITLNEERDSSTIFFQKLSSLVNDNNKSIFTSEETPSQFNKINEETFYGNLGFSNNLDASTILSNIIDYHKDNMSESLSFFLNKANNLLNKTNTKVKLISQLEMDKINPDGLMFYNNNDNTITLVKDSFNRVSPNRMIKGFIHEMSHAVTANAYMNPKTFEEKEFTKLISDAFTQYSKLSESDSYGFKDPLEFIAEIYSNPEFQSELLALDRSKKSTFFSELIDAIRRLFGLSKNATNDSLISASLLIDTVNRMSELDRTNFKGSQYESGYDFGLNFMINEEFKAPKFTNLEDSLNHLVNTAKDTIDQVYNRAKSKKNPKSKETQKEYLKDISTLIDTMASYNETENWKVVLAYTKSFSKTVHSLSASLSKKDLSLPGLVDMIYNYEDYLASYDLLDEIQTLLSTAKQDNKSLTEDNLKDVTEIQNIINGFQSKHSTIVSDFKVAKRNQSIALLSDPRFNTKIETDFRKRLEQEYKDLKVTGESRTQYVSRMLNTRDKEAYAQALKDSASSLANDPTFDITSMAKTLYDPLNTNSRLIEIVTNIVNSVRDKIITQFNTKDNQLGTMFKEFVSKVGSKRPSELYKNMYEQDSYGNYYLKGEYSIKFKDKYNAEFSPILKELTELTEKYVSEGMTKKDYRKQADYKEILNRRNLWLSENTVSDPNSPLGLGWKPKSIYKNAKLSEAEQKVLEEFRYITRNSNKLTGGRASLIRKIKNNASGIEFYKLPAMTKSDFERRIEADVKGVLKDKWTDLTTIKPDDIGYAKEAVSNKGEELRNVRVHFRGKIDSNQQSLDLFTMYRMEYLNGLNYSEKIKEENNLLLIADVAKGKRYIKKSKRTGKGLVNMFSNREPVTLFDGNLSNEYARIKGLIDSNVYDVLSEHAGTIMGMDVNKVTQTVNGVTASIAMSFNIASGTANIFNGMTQLFIESLGDQFISKKSLYKAEKAYTLDLPNVFADLSNPTKTSKTNQILQMFDTFGGFSPAQQTYMKNTIMKKLVSKDSMNGFNEMGEHMMNSVLTMAVLDNLKVMNSEYKYIDSQGNVVEESKAASLLDMLKKDENGMLQMDSRVAYTNQNLGLNYFEGGKTHINLLIKKKTHDLFGVYDPNMQNELYKTFYGKALMMFKRFLIAGLQARYKGIGTANKAKGDLSETDIIYNSALKEYEEGTYTTLVRFFSQGVIPMLKSLSAAHMSEYYNQLTDYEKGNLRKVTTELVFTMVMLPLLGMLLGAAGDGDDDELAFWIYEFRRLDSELSQFRDPLEASRLIANPIAGSRLIQNALSFANEVFTPLNFFPEENENVFSYLDEDSKGKNIFVKKGKKLIPIFSQLNKDYVQMHNFIANPSK